MDHFLSPPRGIGGRDQGSRVLRERQSDHWDAIDRADSPQLAGAARLLVQVFDGGSLPVDPEKIYLTHPVLVTGDEVEGGAPTLTVDAATTVPVVVLRGNPVVADYLIATTVGGRWVAEAPMGFCPCCPCLLPRTNLTIAYVDPAGVSGSGTLTYSSAGSGCVWTGCIKNGSTGAGIGFFDISCDDAGCVYFQATSAPGAADCGARGTYRLYELEYDCSGLLAGAIGPLEIVNYGCSGNQLVFVTSVANPTTSWTITIPKTKTQPANCYGVCQCNDLPTTLTATSTLFGAATLTITGVGSGIYSGAWTYDYPANGCCGAVAGFPILVKLEGYQESPPGPLGVNRCNLILSWQANGGTLCPQNGGIVPETANATLTAISCDPFNATFTLPGGGLSCISTLSMLTGGAADTITITE